MLSKQRLLLEEIVHLAKGLEVYRERLAAQAGCTAALWATLSAAGTGDTVPRIARRLDLTRQSVQKTADALVHRALAKYEPNPHHRRSSLLCPTHAGQTLLERLESARNRWQASIGEGMDAEDEETTLLVLRALSDELARA